MTEKRKPRKSGSAARRGRAIGPASPDADGTTTVLDAAGVKAAIARLCRQIADALPPGQQAQPVALVGLRSRGDELAGRLMGCLSAGRTDLLRGTLDITLYRDDVSKRAVQPTVQATEIEFDLDNAFVILVDDVLHTGRTIRAAMDALMDFGRPAVIRLAVLVDRGGRELPIAPDFVGHRLELPADDPRRVYVELADTDQQDRVYLK